VKYGDGGVDIEPLMHLYKNQIYQIANSLGIIEEIINRKPSPDTFSYAVSDEEYYFRIPFDKLDMLLYSWEKKIPIDIICETMELSEIQVKRAFRDFNSKYIKTEYLREIPNSLI
jgi:NAD+ synthase